MMVQKEIDLPENYKYISVALTMRCNLHCSYCLNEFNSNFNQDLFNEILGIQWIDSLNKINSRPDVPITFSGGEPFLHPDFIEIINGLKKELNIDILTNLYWGKKGIERFIEKVNPERLKRDSKYPSIRVSYHPEQMGKGELLIENVKKLRDAGFNIGIYAVQYPGKKQLEAITQMQFRCLNANLEFRIKDFTGKFEGKDDEGRFFSMTYGDYSKYPESVFQNKTKKCECKTSGLLIGSNGDIYKCHRDIFSREFPIGNITNPEFQPEDVFRECFKYGQCHPCDVKVKTDNKQQLGTTLVEIKNIK